MIDGIRITPLRQIPDERGKIMHMLRANDPHFEKFGEIYFATAYPGVIKGWHLHKRQTQNYACLQGMIKVVLYDPRPDSPTKGEVQEVFMGEDNYLLLTIPPGIVNGWKCIGTKTALLANCATEPHAAGEMDRIDPFSPDIPYRWDIKMQ
ncbi:MAG: dTDP-4-dehydrorhamnose 3,5-epimerase family protein [Kiritimatiellae bacterium]|nr:dTDP-4-dehydrorhamnose 3,5-epimerase family protein [Kiritimatiellia bacterium]